MEGKGEDVLFEHCQHQHLSVPISHTSHRDRKRADAPIVTSMAEEGRQCGTARDATCVYATQVYRKLTALPTTMCTVVCVVLHRLAYIHMYSLDVVQTNRQTDRQTHTHTHTHTHTDRVTTRTKVVIPTEQ